MEKKFEVVEVPPKPTTPPPEPPTEVEKETTSSVPEHSMATNAGSLDAPSQTAAAAAEIPDQTSVKKGKKSKKCCVIL